MPEYQAFDHDVLVIGAGGAGLRAAIAAAAEGVRVGLVCKSLLGKAHTVMAEGGVAAALANVDERDGWEAHFADTMRGGQYMNNWPGSIRASTCTWSARSSRCSGTAVGWRGRSPSTESGAGSSSFAPEPW